MTARIAAVFAAQIGLMTLPAGSRRADGAVKSRNTLIRGLSAAERDVLANFARDFLFAAAMKERGPTP